MIDASVLDHLGEIRRRLFYSLGCFVLCFATCYFFSDQIYAFLVAPLQQAMAESEIQEGTRRLIYTSLPEAFLTYLKVAFWAAFCLSFPLIVAQIWMFVTPGLYKNERRMFLAIIIAIPVLFTLGALVAYYGIFPLAWAFFLDFEVGTGAGKLAIQLETRVSEYLALVMKLIFAFGFCFQLPILLTLLARVGVLTSTQLRQNRRYALVIAFVLAAVLTPPDIISQIGLAVPLILLYEVSIWLARMAEQKGKKK